MIVIYSSAVGNKNGSKILSSSLCLSSDSNLPSSHKSKPNKT